MGLYERQASEDKEASTVEGTPIDQFIMENADPLWLHQNGMWELMPNDQGSVALEDLEYGTRFES